MRRFALQLTDGACESGQGSENTGHVLATRRSQGRVQTRNQVEQEYGNLEIALRRGNAINLEETRKLEKLAEAALDME